MRSSCPNIIKHYASMQFSQIALDYEVKRGKKYGSNYIDNKNLDSHNFRMYIKNSPNVVLIFKNKSCREFSAKKKIKRPSLINQMQQKNRQFVYQIQNQENNLFIKNVQLCQMTNFDFQKSKPKSTQTYRKKKPRLQISQNMKRSQNIRNTSSTKNCSSVFQTIKSGKSINANDNDSSLEDIEQGNSCSKLFQLKIKGSLTGANQKLKTNDLLGKNRFKSAQFTNKSLKK